MFGLYKSNGEETENDKSVTSKLSNSKPSKRSRRRRNMKSRKKNQVEPTSDSNVASNGSSKKHHDAPMTKSDLYFALDCEMVGIGPEGFDSALARVTIVNWENQIVLDTFVKVPVPVTDYRTHVSGITPQDIESEDAMTFEEARSIVEDILRGKILIGHGLDNDLCALNLTHPFCDVRDTATYPPYMREAPPVEVTGYEDTNALSLSNFRPRKLRDLTWEQLGRQIQHEGVPHSPIEDAIAALDLYKAQREAWELALSRRQQQQQRQQDSAIYHPHHVTGMLSYPSAVPPAAAVAPTAAVYPPGYSPFTPTMPRYAAGFSPSPLPPTPPPQRGQPMRQSSWRWMRRPRSPGGERSKSPPPTVVASLEEKPDDLCSLRSVDTSLSGVPEPQLTHHQQQRIQRLQRLQRPISPRSRWFFRRTAVPPPPPTHPVVRQVPTFGTDASTVCTECESNAAVDEARSRTTSWAASDHYGENGDIREEPWQPEYNFFEEWNQSFQQIPSYYTE